MVSVSKALGGSPVPVLIQFIGGNPQDGVQPGGRDPGQSQHIYATAPRAEASGPP